MSIFHAIILGIVQGLTEFLPVSSSGHLIILPELFGWPESGVDFDVMIHLATLCAVVWTLREDILGILGGLFSKKHDKEGVLGWKILVGTLPVVFVGFFLADSVLDSFRNMRGIAVMLILWGILLWAADVYARKYTARVSKVENVTWRQSIVIGLFQAMSLMPGTSRSGATITGGLFFGLDRATAARFSFLLSIPAIAGAGLLTTIDAIHNGYTTGLMPMIFGFAAAFISGMFAIRFMLTLIQKISYGWFAGYRIILGIILLFAASFILY